MSQRTYFQRQAESRQEIAELATAIEGLASQPTELLEAARIRMASIEAKARQVSAILRGMER